MILRIIAILLVGCSCYLLWAWYRSDLWFIAHDALWPRGFPYPDKPVRELERYWDQARPAPKGSVKMHGEFRRVERVIGAAAGVCAAAGVACGLRVLKRLKR